MEPLLRYLIFLVALAAFARRASGSVARRLKTRTGRLLADYGSKKLFMEGGQQPDPIEQTIPNSIGHHKEWIEAVKGNGKTTCHFEYGGALAEAGLLGNVSYRAGKKKLEWDAEKLKATNCPEADQYIRREYRKGWVL